MVIEIKNQKFRKAMKKAGLQDIHLMRNKDYFYIWADEGTMMEEVVTSLESTSIYVYRFNNLTIDQWINEIRELLRGF